MMIKLTATCFYEGVVREGDMVFLENCRMNGKREMIMLQMAGLMGSLPIRQYGSIVPLVTLNSQILYFSSRLYRLHMVAELYFLMRLLVIYPFSKFSR